MIRRCVVLLCALGLLGCLAIDRDSLTYINEHWPAPIAPSLESREEVREVTAAANLVVEGEVTIALAGVVCNKDMADYMRALFFGNEPDTIIYRESGYSRDGKRFVYAWDIAVWELGDADLEFPPSITSLNETGLLSGWCKPEQQEFHQYHRRYVALSDLSRSR